MVSRRPISPPGTPAVRAYAPPSRQVPIIGALGALSHHFCIGVFQQPAGSISIKWYTMATRTTKNGDGTDTCEWSIHLGNLAHKTASWRELVRMGGLVQISTRKLELGQGCERIRSSCVADGTHSETQRMSSILGRTRMYSTYRRSKQLRL